jgi:UDP-N-acetylglucosamine transferase subunit ALG13
VNISYAGIGSVLTAPRYSKPILLFPRRAEQKEHHNDDQMATISKFAGRPGILIAQDEIELAERIAEARALGEGLTRQAPAAQQLHTALARFMDGEMV